MSHDHSDPRHEINCQECVDFLMDYLDGLLPEKQRNQFEAHLAICPNCTTFMNNYRQAAELAGRVGRADQDKPLADAPAELIVAILKARKQGQ